MKNACSIIAYSMMSCPSQRLGGDAGRSAMRGKIISSTIASALLVVCGTIAFLTTRNDRPSADVQRVARKYAAALGGPARFKNIGTREIQGTFEYKGIGQHATGELELKWKAPGSLVEQLR